VKEILEVRGKIRETLKRALREVLVPGVERIERVTVVFALPFKEEEKPLLDAERPEIPLSLKVREEEKPPPKFYYSLDEKQWWEIPGELTRVWQLRFIPKDIGVREGIIKVKGEFGDQKVERKIHIRSSQQHILELAEPQVPMLLIAWA